MKRNSKKRNIILFDISPLGYLKRAKKLLRKSDIASFFYAALELRCAIEARAREQLFSLDKLPKKAKRLWSAEMIMRELEKRIYGAKFHIKLILNVRGYKRKIRPFTYKPIDKSILAEYGKLGNLLHSQRKNISTKFVNKTRDWLNQLYLKIEERCKGHMLRPPAFIIKCSKCGRLLDWEAIHKNDNSSILCGCGHKASLIGKRIEMSITCKKKSARTVELIQADYVKGEI